MNQDSPKLTVALTTTEYITEPNFDGGLANYVHRLALSLKKLGHYPIVVVSSDKNEVFINQDIEVHRIHFKLSFPLKVLNVLSLRKLNFSLGFIFLSLTFNQKLKEISKSKHLSIIQYPSCASLGLFRVKSIPSVTRISSYLPLWNQAYNLNQNIDLKMVEKLEEIAFLQTDALFCPSQINAKIVEQVTGRAVTVIETPFILDTSELDYSLFDQHLKDKKYLLFFGTIGIMKGCGLIAEIIHDLLERHPDLYFVLVGKDTDYLGYQGISLVDQIKKNARSYQDKIIHFNRLNHSCLYPIIANTYAVVLPSRIDNFPNTCLEAMAHKKIVIGTHGTSFEQLITDGVSGFLCQKDNPQDLLFVLEKVLQLSEPERITIGDKAYERIQELNPEKVVNQLVDFYKMIIHKFDGKNNRNKNNAQKS